MKDNDHLPDPEFEDDEAELLNCPNCGREYDEIDVDYLICSRCWWSVDENSFVIKPRNTQ